jgi:DNA (cytosine-5)-methyltransferase 1
LFPGIGLLDRAFEEVGFTVVRGPDPLWGGDIRRFHPPPGKFDGVIGGPPCQEFSPLAAMVRQNGYTPTFGNLIPEFERVVAEAEPAWFLMENVRAAPVPEVPGYGVFAVLINNRWCLDEDGEPDRQNRLRRWSFGHHGGRRVLMIETAVFEHPEIEYAACGGTHGIGGIGREQIKKHAPGQMARLGYRAASDFEHLKAIQGLPDDYDLPGFKVSAKCKAVGNGVPYPMARAMARAVLEATATETIGVAS